MMMIAAIAYYRDWSHAEPAAIAVCFRATLRRHAIYAVTATLPR